MSDLVLKISDLGKCYKTYRSNFTRFASWFGFSAKPTDEYWALKDVSFKLHHGEALAIIGQNGAGKSTLLKLITGTIRASAGSVQINGRVSAILELGLGFNPDFTGRQNVYLAGGLMGLSNSEIATLMPSIEEFTEIGEFFERPLHIYSSGMQARLAFSVATAVRPDILIVDEVLSVGDSYFQHKSFARIREFSDQGTSILLVTHSLGDVRALCNRALLLANGKVLNDGLADEVIDFYNALIAEKENAKLSVEHRRGRDGWLIAEFGTKQATVESLLLKDFESNQPVQMVRVGQKLVAEFDVLIHDEIKRLVLGHRITDRTGHVIWGTNTWHTKQLLENLKPNQKICFRLAFDCLLGPGSYALSFGLVSSDTHLDDCYHKKENALIFDVVNSEKNYFIGTSWQNIVVETKVIDLGNLS